MADPTTEDHERATGPNTISRATGVSDVFARTTGEAAEKGAHAALHTGGELFTRLFAKGAGAEVAEVTVHAAEKGMSALHFVGPIVAFGAEYGVSRLAGESPAEALVGSGASVALGAAAGLSGAPMLTVAAAGITGAVTAKALYKMATGETRHENLLQIAKGTIPATEFAAELQDPKSNIRQTVTEKLTAEFEDKNADLKQTFGSNYEQATAWDRNTFVKDRTAQLIMENARQPDMPNSYGLTEKDVKGGYVSPGVAAAAAELKKHIEPVEPAITAAEFARELQNPQSDIRKTITGKLTAEFEDKNADLKQTFGSSYEAATAQDRAIFVKDRTAQLIIENEQHAGAPNSYALTEKDVKHDAISSGVTGHGGQEAEGKAPHGAELASTPKPESAATGISKDVLAAALSCGLKAAGVSHGDNEGRSAASAPQTRAVAPQQNCAAR